MHIVFENKIILRTVWWALIYNQLYIVIYQQVLGPLLIYPIFSMWLRLLMHIQDWKCASQSSESVLGFEKALSWYHHQCAFKMLFSSMKSHGSLGFYHFYKLSYNWGSYLAFSNFLFISTFLLGRIVLANILMGVIGSFGRSNYYSFR